MVIIRQVLAIERQGNTAVRIQRMDGGTPPQPVGPDIVLTMKEWQRIKELLESDKRLGDMSSTGADDGTGIYWVP